MSAIGDYVHLYRKHYGGKSGSGIQKWSKETKGSYTAYNFGQQKQILQTRMANNASGLTDAEILELRTNLSYILSTNNNDATVAGQKVSEIQEKITQILTDRWQERMGNIDFDTGNISANSIVAERNELLTYIGKAKNEKKRQLNTIYKRIQGLESLKNNITSPSTKANIISKINNIKTSLAQLFNVAEADLEALASTKITFEATSATNEQIGSMISDLNNIIKVMGATPPINLQKGDFFEYAIAALGGMIKADAEDGIYTAMSQVVGGNREAVTIQMDKFSDQFNPSMVGLNVALDENGNSINLGASQGKIDVILNLSDGNVANISAKNVNLSSGYDVHILSGSSLLYLLQDQDGDFINHYLNLAAWHPDGIGDLTDQLMAAREAIKMTILWQAISGDVNGRQVADVFIINDNGKTGIESIQVYDIPKLVERAWTNLDALVTITSSTGETIDSLTFYNQRSATSYSERISKLLANVHAQKISAALSPTLFKS